MYVFLASKRLYPISLKRRVKSASSECRDKCTRLINTKSLFIITITFLVKIVSNIDDACDELNTEKVADEWVNWEEGAFPISNSCGLGLEEVNIYDDNINIKFILRSQQQ